MERLLFRKMLRGEPRKQGDLRYSGTLEHLLSIDYKNIIYIRVYTRVRARSSNGLLQERGKMKESQIEKFLVRKIKEGGGLCFKFISPGNPGVPDRIVITPTGKTIYVELKTETGQLTKMQKLQIEQIREKGADVRVLYGIDGVKAFLREVFQNAV